MVALRVVLCLEIEEFFVIIKFRFFFFNVFLGKVFCLKFSSNLHNWPVNSVAFSASQVSMPFNIQDKDDV